MLLCSLSDKYPGEGINLPITQAVGWIVSLFFYRDGFGIK